MQDVYSATDKLVLKCAPLFCGATFTVNDLYHFTGNYFLSCVVLIYNQSVKVTIG